MSKDVPVGRKSPSPSPFRRLSAGSVEGASWGHACGESNPDTSEVDYCKYIESVHLAGLYGLERAVATTSESARTLDKARVSVEEVSSANKVAAQSLAFDVDAAATVAERLLNRILDNPGRAHKAQAGSGSGKGWHGLLG
jgi:hypothetical protein